MENYSKLTDEIVTTTYEELIHKQYIVVTNYMLHAKLSIIYLSQIFLPSV